MNYTKCRLGDVAEIIMSSIDKKSKPNEKTVRLCNFTDVYHNWAITKDKYDTFMIATASDTAIEKLTLKKGYVAFTKDSETRDDIGIPTYIADDFDDVVLGYHCALVKPNEHKLSGEYLNAFMNSDYIKKYFELNATGSGMRFTLAIQTLEGMPLILPDLSEQKRIAKVLTDIDSKIAVNKKINKELEVMAKELYDYWFVQFDFPNADGKPYKSSGGKMVYNEVLKREIPDSWEVKKIGNILDDVPKSKKLQTDEYLNDGNTPIIDQGDKYITGYTNDKNIINKFPAVVFGDHSCKVKLINFPFARGADGTQILYSKEESVSEYYLYFTVKELDLDTGYARHFAYLRDFLPIIVPDNKIGKRYTNIVKTYFDEIKNHIFENIELCRLRDELLPMLMNGQVSMR